MWAAWPNPRGFSTSAIQRAIINPGPLEELAGLLDGACIDLKAFDGKFYRELVDAELEPVLNTLKTLRRHKVHVEIVNLVIPQLNNAPDQLTRMCAWIKDELGPLTPLHFSRFYPLYKMLNHYPTPVSTLERARDLARKAGLQYVYIGNLPGHEAENTFCHHCRENDHRPPGLQDRRDPPQGRQLRLLRRGHPGDLG